MLDIILHGGYGGHWDNAGQDISLFNHLIKKARESDKKILISFTSSPNLDDFPFINEMKKTFNTIAPDISLTIASQENLRDHLSNHQVLFLQGGDSIEHQRFLNDFSNEEIIKNKKLIAGSSSGVSLLCTYGFTSRNKGEPLKGKSIIDIDIIPHADAWPIDKYLPKLQTVTSRPILLIQENSFVQYTLPN